MGVSATRDSWEIFPTRLSTPQEYWGNSLVKTGLNGEYFTRESWEIISENKFVFFYFCKNYDESWTQLQTLILTRRCCVESSPGSAECCRVQAVGGGHPSVLDRSSGCDRGSGLFAAQRQGHPAASQSVLRHPAASQSVLRHCWQTS